MKVLFFQTARGRMPVVDELESLPKEASAHAYQLLEEIEENGFDASRVIFRHIEGKLWEIKMTLPGTGGYRIFYFTLHGNTVLLLHAYSKKSQKAPKHHIDTALERMGDAIRRSLK
jgi:phage-related protein